jgi:hypothetical protein
MSDKGNLGKITFVFYPSARAPGIGVSYTPMYNPTSFSVTHDVKYDKNEKPVYGTLSKKFLTIKPRTVSMELFFDGTGASPSSLGGFGDTLSLNSGILNSMGVSLDLDKVANAVGPDVNTVEGQIQAFLKLSYQIAGAFHKPSYIMIVWGTFLMTGVLTSANVNYTMFDADGTPIRAKLAITIEEYVGNTLIAKLLNLQSPDLSKCIVVKEGDTLPLLCFREYGISNLYTKIAEVNNLKNYRKLKQGMELLFPPINNLV